MHRPRRANWSSRSCHLSFHLQVLLLEQYQQEQTRRHPHTPPHTPAWTPFDHKTPSWRTEEVVLFWRVLIATNFAHARPFLCHLKKLHVPPKQFHRRKKKKPSKLGAKNPMTQHVQGPLSLQTSTQRGLARARRDRAPLSHLGSGCIRLLGLQQHHLKPKEQQEQAKISCLFQRQYRIIKSSLEIAEDSSQSRKTYYLPCRPRVKCPMVFFLPFEGRFTPDLIHGAPVHKEPNQTKA